MKKILLLMAIIVSLTACDSDKNYDLGYNDGYAVGYNTVCKVKRGNLIKGDWESKNYSLGYEDGYDDGASDCRNKK